MNCRSLLITAGVFILYGLPPVFDPTSAASVLGLSINDANGATSIRAIYGGYLIGGGLLFALAASKAKYVKSGLIALLLIVSPILVSRCVGLASEQHISSDQLLRVGMESASIIVTSLLLWSLSKAPTGD